MSDHDDELNVRCKDNPDEERTSSNSGLLARLDRSSIEEEAQKSWGVVKHLAEAEAAMETLQKSIGASLSESIGLANELYASQLLKVGQIPQTIFNDWAERLGQPIGLEALAINVPDVLSSIGTGPRWSDAWTHLTAGVDDAVRAASDILAAQANNAWINSVYESAKNAVADTSNVLAELSANFDKSYFSSDILDWGELAQELGRGLYQEWEGIASDQAKLVSGFADFLINGGDYGTFAIKYVAPVLQRFRKIWVRAYWETVGSRRRDSIPVDTSKEKPPTDWTLSPIAGKQVRQTYYKLSPHGSLYAGETYSNAIRVH